MTGSRLKAGGAVLALAVAFVGAWEGLKLRAYLDTGGVPTICYGATRGVKLGMVETKEGCDRRLLADLVEHETGMRACLKQPDALSDATYTALLSFTFNVGTGAACRSTMFRHFNAGRFGAGCNELSRWVNDNGKRIRGLVNRRAAERDLCLSGLK